jgi:hypothetical protein
MIITPWSSPSWDAYYSAKMLNVIDYYNVYADAKGNEFLCTTVCDVGISSMCNWDDLIYLGVMVKYVRRVDKSIWYPHIPNPNLRIAPIKPQTSGSIVAASVAINDYVCPNCSNDRCSKTEKFCWRCEFKFQR